MAIIINDVNTERFNFNGIPYYKNFTSLVEGTKIQIFSAYDRSFELMPFTDVSDVILNGSTFANVADLQDALLPVIYTRATLGTGTTSAVAPRITVFGNKFFLIKHPTNNNPSNVNVLERLDIIVNGFRSSTDFWYAAQYTTIGNVNDENNWTIFTDQGIT